MTMDALSRMLNPASIALVGASPEAGKLAGGIRHGEYHGVGLPLQPLLDIQLPAQKGVYVEAPAASFVM